MEARVAGAEGTFQRTLQVSGPARVAVETGSGDIEVKTGSAGIVKVEGHIRARSGLWDGVSAEERVRDVQGHPPIEQSENEVRIGRRPRWNNVSISYVVTVPDEASVEVRTGSGDVRIGDVRGAVSARTGSGDIELGRIPSDLSAQTGSGDVRLRQGGGNVRVATGSGDVFVRVAGAGRLEVETGSGDVDVDGASGRARVRTGSGAIAVTGNPTAEWDLAASAGDVRIDTAAAAAFTVDARSASGDIDARAVVVSGPVTSRHLRGTVRGGGPTVSMSTGSGEIRIR
jgi:DUF4097 and DUF4098 domain-containing protein YvlB